MTHSSRDNKPVAVEQLLPCPFCGAPASGLHKSGSAWFIECEHAPECWLADFHPVKDKAATAWNHRLRLAGQDRGEGFREALNRIADLGCCGGSGKFEAALDIAVSALTSAALSTQPPPVSDEPVAWMYERPTAKPGHKPHRVVEFGGNRWANHAGWTETPLYARQALAHAAVGEGYAEGLEAAAKRADYEVELSEDNIREGYDLKFNNAALKVAKRIAFGIRSLSAAPRTIPSVKEGYAIVPENDLRELRNHLEPARLREQAKALEGTADRMSVRQLAKRVDEILSRPIQAGKGK